MKCGLCGKNARIAGKTCPHLARGPLVTWEKKSVCLRCSDAGEKADVPLCADCLDRSERVNLKVDREDRKRGWMLAERAPYFAGVELARPHVPDVSACSQVKLVFCLVPSREPAWLENLWVRPLRQKGTRWIGVLESEPRIVTSLLRGVEVEFEAKNVVMGRFDASLVLSPHDCLYCSVESRPDLDAVERKVLQDVRKWGWHVIQVFEDGDRPAYAYTIGLAHRFEHPELIVIGLEDEIAGGVLNRIAGTIRDGARVQPFSRLSGHLDGAALLAVPVKKTAYRDHLGIARWFHRGDDFDTLQLLWPGEQPLLGPASKAPSRRPKTAKPKRKAKTSRR